MSTVPASLKRLAATTAIALAVTGVAARAVAVESQGSADASFTVDVSPPPADAPPTTTAPLPPVSIVPLPAGTAAAPASAEPTQSMQQTIVVVISSGTMSVSPTSATVVLHRDGNSRLVGDFGPITVVDARGSLAGWTLTAALASPIGGRATIRPGAVDAVTGRPGEATAARRGDLTTAAGTVIMSAVPEGGGGDFAISGTIEVNGDQVAGDTTAVQLSFAVS